jgi:two-component system chemotaxis response regulator CheY
MALVIAVDDNRILRQLLTLTLSTVGSIDSSVKFTVFETGEEVIACAEQSLVDLFIIDWCMPGYSGGSLLRNIRSHPRYETTPIIILSGEDDLASKEEAKLLGATGWLVKPFNPNTLKMLIYKLLGRYSAGLSIALPDNYEVYV